MGSFFGEWTISEVTYGCEQERDSHPCYCPQPEVSFLADTHRSPSHADARNPGLRLTLPVPFELTAILKKQFRQLGQPVFSSVNLRKEWHKVTALAKCPHLLIHDLRRSGVRNPVQAGVQEKVAMMISGHKTRSVFDRYNIISPKQIVDAMTQVERSDGSLLKSM